MFIEIGNNLLNVNDIGYFEVFFSKVGGAVFVYLNKEILHSGKYLDNMIIYSSSSKEDCKKYMAELKAELAALGKLVRVEVE